MTKDKVYKLKIMYEVAHDKGQSLKAIYRFQNKNVRYQI